MLSEIEQVAYLLSQLDELRRLAELRHPARHKLPPVKPGQPGVLTQFQHDLAHPFTEALLKLSDLHIGIPQHVMQHGCSQHVRVTYSGPTSSPAT